MKNEHIEYTTVSELIAQLQELSDRLGPETAVAVNGVSKLYVIDKPYYYDGGYYAVAKVDGIEKHVHSKHYVSGGVTLQKGFVPSVIHLIEDQTTEEII